MSDLETKLAMIRERLGHEIMASVSEAFADLCGALADDFDDTQKAKALNGEPTQRVQC